jgi:hypothetical protein
MPREPAAHRVRTALLVAAGLIVVALPLLFGLHRVVAWLTGGGP